MSLSQIVETLAFLAPYDVIPAQKIRLGSQFDGGYVMLNRLRPQQVVMSYGLSWNITFDHDLAQRGHTLHMFDHTIDGLTQQHPLFNWHREGVAAVANPSVPFDTIASHLERFGVTGNDLLLKIDVEGAEWDVFASMEANTMRRFEQIVVEFHDMTRMNDDGFRAKIKAALQALSRDFVLHHVHANNCAPVLLVDGMPVADVIEASYVRADLVTAYPSTGYFPTVFDAANDIRLPDHPLWFFPYLPGAVIAKAGLLREAERLDPEK